MKLKQGVSLKKEVIKKKDYPFVDNINHVAKKEEMANKMC